MITQIALRPASRKKLSALWLANYPSASRRRRSQSELSPSFHRLRVDHLHAPVFEARGRRENSERIKGKSAAFAIDAVGADIEGPNGTGRDRAAFSFFQDGTQLLRRSVFQRGAVRGLPMADQAAAGHQAPHHGIQR